MNRRGTSIALWGAAIIAVVAIVVGPVFGYTIVVIPFVVGAVVGSVVGGMAVAAGHNRESYLGGATSDAVVGWQEFHRELARSRRFGRTFGLVRFPAIDVAEAPTAHLRDRIAARARRNDRVWIDGSDLFVLLPEADADAVGAAVARTLSHAAGALGNGVSAVFPASGITSGALIASLYGEQAAPVAIGSWAPVVATISHADDIDAAGDMAETAT